MSNVAVNFFEKLVDKELHFNYNINEILYIVHRSECIKLCNMRKLKKKEKVMKLMAETLAGVYTHKCFSK